MRWPSTLREAGGSEREVGCITHERQRPQGREVGEDPSRDTRKLVVFLLRDGKGTRSEAEWSTWRVAG